MIFPRDIYAIKHNVTNRIYVGSTHNLRSRLYAHMSCLRNGKHSNASMQLDFDKYGESYTFYLIEKIHSFGERNKESLYMDALNTRKEETGYNTTDQSGEFDIAKCKTVQMD